MPLFKRGGKKRKEKKVLRLLSDVYDTDSQRMRVAGKEMPCCASTTTRPPQWACHHGWTHSPPLAGYRTTMHVQRCQKQILQASRDNVGNVSGGSMDDWDASEAEIQMSDFEDVKVTLVEEEE